MLRPSPNHGTLRLPYDDDHEAVASKLTSALKRRAAKRGKCVVELDASSNMFISHLGQVIQKIGSTAIIIVFKCIALYTPGTVIAVT